MIFVEHFLLIHLNATLIKISMDCHFVEMFCLFIWGVFTNKTINIKVCLLPTPFYVYHKSVVISHCTTKLIVILWLLSHGFCWRSTRWTAKFHLGPFIYIRIVDQTYPGIWHAYRLCLAATIEWCLELYHYHYHYTTSTTATTTSASTRTKRLKQFKTFSPA